VAQLYVMIPGNPQPQLLEIDEVVRRVRAGELPATANAARLGETNWTPLKDLPEISAPLAASPSQAGNQPAIAPGPSSLGAPLWSEHGNQPALPATQGGLPQTQASAAPAPGPSQAGAPGLFTPPPAQAGPAPSGGGLPKGVMIGGGAAVFVLLLGIILIVWFRGSYSRGLVFEHIPDNCGAVYYFDLQGLATSDPLKPHLEKLMKNAKDLSDDELESKSKKDKERFQRVLDALKKNGVDDKSVREVAVCIPTVDEDDKDKAKTARVEEHGLLLIGGTWRKGDVLQGIKEAVEGATGSEDICKIDDDDGLRLLKCSPDLKGKKEPVYAALVDGRVLAISPDKKLIKSVRPSKDQAKKYEAGKGEHVVIWTSSVVPGWDGSYGYGKLKIEGDSTILTVETRYDAEKGKKKLDQFKDPDELAKKKEKFLKNAAEKCFEKSDLDILADSVEKAKVEVFDDGIRYEYKVPNKDLSKAIKFLSDADKGDMKKMANIPICVAFAVDPVASY
jgi:hypothetical protein